MSFFNNLGRKVGQTGQGTMSRTKVMTETSRINGIINDSKRRMENAVKEVGHFYCEKYRNNPDPEIAEQVNLVTQLNAQIEELQIEVRRINGLLTCPSCGKIVRQGEMFCSNCGMMVEPSYQQYQPQYEGNVCHSCGYPVNEGTVFCTRCGTPVSYAGSVQQNNFQNAGADGYGAPLYDAPYYSQGNNDIPMENINVSSEDNEVKSPQAESVEYNKTVVESEIIDSAEPIIKAGSTDELSENNTYIPSSNPSSGSSPQAFTDDSIICEKEDERNNDRADEEQSVKLCPCCGYECKIESRFCLRCGEKL